MIVEKKKDRLVWGVLIAIIGLILIVLQGLLVMTTNVSLILGIPLFVLGLIIILNKSEDNIEKRKDLNQNK